MRSHYLRVVESTNARVTRSLSRQITDEKSRFFGGFLDDNELVEAKYAIYRLTSMIAAYSCADSRHFQSAAIAERALLALGYVARAQHPNGLFDLIDCNFFSAPDTAFCVKRLLPALRYLRDAERDPWQEKLYQAMLPIVRKGAQGLLLGGFHTPNHRWAIASNLVDCGDFFSNPALAKGAEAYLREGIDIDVDGQYAERSSGNYNRINNDAMLTLSRFTGDARYEEYAVRNLRLMLDYIEPDGTIFTANSTRQDNGKRIFLKDYYWQYLTLGAARDLPDFLAVAATIFAQLEENHLSAPDILIHFLNRPEMIGVECPAQYVFPDFQRHYVASGLARVRRERYTLTLMRGKSDFLHLSGRELDLVVKLGGSLCEHRAFVPETLEMDKDGFTLTQTMHGWYYLPFDTPPDTSDWWAMNNASRKKLSGPDLRIEARVTLLPDGVELRMKLSGVENAPFRVELAALGARYVESDAFRAPCEAGGHALLKRGTARLIGVAEAMRVGEAFAAHAYTGGKFGSETRDRNAFTLYVTEYTPFERALTFRVEDR